MFEKIYKSQGVILQLRDGILGKHIDDFATYFIKQGYSQKTFCSRFGLISHFSARKHLERPGNPHQSPYAINQRTSYYTFYKRSNYVEQTNAKQLIYWEKTILLGITRLSA